MLRLFRRRRRLHKRCLAALFAVGIVLDVDAASAQLRAAYLAAETENFAALEARLKPLIDARGPFSYLARELIGVEAYEAGQNERARTEFTYLESAFDAPQGVRGRASRYLSVLGPAPETAAPAAPAKTGEKK